MHDALALSFQAVADHRVVHRVAVAFVGAMRIQRMPDCISVIGLVEPWLLARTLGKNRARRPLSFIGIAHARGSAAACGWRRTVSQVLSGWV